MSKDAMTADAMDNVEKDLRSRHASQAPVGAWRSNEELIGRIIALESDVAALGRGQFDVVDRVADLAPRIAALESALAKQRAVNEALRAWFDPLSTLYDHHALDAIRNALK